MNTCWWFGRRLRRMQQLAAEPPYRVLQRDDAAHIVWDTAGRRWGCVFFVPQEVTPHTVAKETLPVKAG